MGLRPAAEDMVTMLPDFRSFIPGKMLLMALTSYDIHRRLVVEGKWSADRYEKWLGDTLVRSLLKSE